jgi:hypothetical protein
MQGYEFTFYNFSYFQVSISFRLALRTPADEYDMPLLGTHYGLNPTISVPRCEVF